MVMDFLKSFKQKKNEFNKEYINVCVFIDKIHNEEHEQITNIALAIQYFGLQDKVSTFTVGDKLIANLNKSNDIFKEFCNKLVAYGHDHTSGIKKDEYLTYKNLYLKKDEIESIPEFKDTIKEKGNNADGYETFSSFLKLWDSPKSIQNHSHISLLEAACLISRDYPRSISERIGALDITEDWDFISARKYIIENIKNERLYIDEEWLGIPTYLLKVVLFEDEKIIKGFNDDILTSVYDELISPTIKLILKNDDDFKLPVEINIPPNMIDNVMNSYPMALEKKVKNLEKRLEEYEAAENDLSIKDSALLLIATMKDMLLNTEITGYLFQSDTDKGKKNPTQSALTEYIDSMNINGLKARVVNNLLSDANKKMNENAKK